MCVFAPVLATACVCSRRWSRQLIVLLWTVVRKRWPRHISKCKVLCVGHCEQASLRYQVRTHATVVSCVDGICFGFVRCARFPMGAYHLARVRGDFEDEWSSWQVPFRCYARSVCVGLRPPSAAGHCAAPRDVHQVVQATPWCADEMVACHC